MASDAPQFSCVVVGCKATNSLHFSSDGLAFINITFKRLVLRWIFSLVKPWLGRISSSLPFSHLTPPLYEAKASVISFHAFSVLTFFDITDVFFRSSDISLASCIFLSAL